MAGALAKGRDDGAGGAVASAAASPRRSAAIEEAVLSVRAEHPAWGGRKIASVLKDAGLGSAVALDDD